MAQAATPRRAPGLTGFALLLIALAALRVFSTYSQLSLTFDEPVHLVCGLEYLDLHQYTCEAQHPPLARAMAALGPYLEGARYAGKDNKFEEGLDILWHAGHPRRSAALMRLGTLPFFLAACLVVFFWTRRDFGPPAALLATAIFTLIPTVLAHAGLATTDMALTATLAAAFAVFTWWLRSPNWRRSLLLGLVTGLALLAKFSALVFLPAAAALVLLTRRFRFWERFVRWALVYAAGAVLAAITAGLLVWAAYGFSWNHGPAPEWRLGIYSVVAHNTAGHISFLLGKSGTDGWWYFFPVALAVKTPLPLLLLLPAGLAVCWRQRARAGLLPVALALGTLVPAMFGRINIGSRHVLPVYLAMAIIGALGVLEIARWGGAARWRFALPAALLLWLVLTGARQHPDYLSYFNPLAGSRPDKVIADSDLDWGQAWIQLGHRLRKEGITEVAILPMEDTWGSPDYVLRYFQEFCGLPYILPVGEAAPTRGWNVISPTRLRLDPLFIHATRPWWLDMDFKERVGPLLLYRSTP